MIKRYKPSAARDRAYRTANLEHTHSIAALLTLAVARLDRIIDDLEHDARGQRDA